MTIKRTFKDSKKVKRMRNYVLIKCNLYLYFLIKAADFTRKNADASKSQGLFHVIYIFLGSSLSKA